MADVAIKSTTVTAAPEDYRIPGAQELFLKAVHAVFDGHNASGAYLPCLQLLSPDGIVMWTSFPSSPVAAGASADVSWFPDVTITPAQTTAKGITDLTSSLGTIAVNNPTGPTTNVDLPNLNPPSGSYGDASHSTEITVDAYGRITSAAQVAIAGGASTIGFEIGYDQKTTSVTITSTTEATGTTVIACGAHTFDGAAVIGEFFCVAGSINASAGANFTVCLFEGATEIGELCSLEQPVGTGVGITVTLIGKLRFTPTAGSHTYTVTAFKSAAGPTCSLVAGSGGTGGVLPMYMRFTKV